MNRLARPLMYAGIFGCVVALSKYHAKVIGKYDFTGSSRFAWALAFAGLCSLFAYGLGLPDLPRSRRTRLPTAVFAPALAGLAISTVQLFIGDRLLPRFVVLGTVVVLVPWFYGVSAFADVGRRTLESRDRVLVVGPASLASELSDELSRAPERPASIVLAISESDAQPQRSDRPLIEAVVDQRATVVVLSRAAQEQDSIVEQAAQLHESGVRVRTRSLFYEEWLGKIPVADLGRVALFFDIGEVHREQFGRFKRIIDLVAASVGLVVLLVVVPFVFLANMLGNRGPLFYRQDRVGRKGVPFSMLKFRTMSTGPEVVTQWTITDDPRVTRFGKALRLTHLDELPQVWNILRGDLSLVGPRPEQPMYVAELAKTLPFYDLRHIVRPGLTGWAQVKHGYAATEGDALHKLQYDFHYLRRQSLLFDLKIVGRTVRSIIGRGGR